MDIGALQQELQELVPAVEEANSISEDLDRKAKFEIIILSPEMVGQTSGKAEVSVCSEWEKEWVNNNKQQQTQANFTQKIVFHKKKKLN